MSLPLAIVIATGLLCATVLTVVFLSFAWVNRNVADRACPHCGQRIGTPNSSS
jgi:hypothetical protein